MYLEDLITIKKGKNCIELRFTATTPTEIEDLTQIYRMAFLHGLPEIEITRVIGRKEKYQQVSQLTIQVYYLNAGKE